MPEQNHPGSGDQSHTRNRPKVKEALVVAGQADLEQISSTQLLAERVGVDDRGGRVLLEPLLHGPNGAFGGGTLEHQAAWFGDPRLQTVQRQALAAQVGRMQGNRHLQRLVASLKEDQKAQQVGNGPDTYVADQRHRSREIIQRYPVGVPPDASCAEVLDWLNTSNPHVPNWALTSVTFRWGGDFRITGSAPTFHLRVGNPRVIMTGPSVDMPQWRPSDAAVRRAWRAMYRTLRAHEGEHEGIARTWRRTLTRRLTALDLEVTASSREEVNEMAEGLIQAEWDNWLEDHQRDQDAIDPYTAPLHCPEASGSGEGT